MMQGLRDRWDGWTQRERRMVVAMGAVAALALVYLALIDPALEGRKRLLRDLPKLRTDASEMAGIAAAANRLPKPVTGGSLRPAVEASLQAAGLKAAVSANANGSVTVRLEKAGYNAIAAWMFRAARELGARVEVANVSSLGEGGRVNAEFTLSR